MKLRAHTIPTFPAPRCFYSNSSFFFFCYWFPALSGILLLLVLLPSAPFFFLLPCPTESTTSKKPNLKSAKRFATNKALKQISCIHHQDDDGCSLSPSPTPTLSFSVAYLSLPDIHRLCERNVKQKTLEKQQLYHSRKTAAATAKTLALLLGLIDLP